MKSERAKRLIEDEKRERRGANIAWFLVGFSLGVVVALVTVDLTYLW